MIDIFRLPEIYKELEKTISETRERLNKLPKAPSSDPINDISNLIYTFTADLSRHVEGVPDQDGLLQTIRPAQEKFRKTIQATAPNFQPYEEQFRANRSLSSPSFLLNEEDQENASESQDGEDGDDPIYIDEVMERAHK